MDRSISSKLHYMKNVIWCTLFCLILASCGTDTANTSTTTTANVQNSKIEVNYPETRSEAVADDYFGTTVNDPFRWLEIDTAAETESWVKAQNEVTFGYLEQRSKAVPIRPLRTQKAHEPT